MTVTVETYPSLAEASSAMRDRSFYLGGGTLLMHGLNYGAHGVERVVRTTDVSLRDIRSEGSGLRIGAGVRMCDIVENADLQFLAPAARAIGGPAVRNMATVGGNLFARSPYGDLTTALLALDAMVQMADLSSIPIENFLANRDAQRGLVAAVTVPRPSHNAFRFRKVTRTKPKGPSVLCIAAHLPGGSRITDARIAFGAMGATPLRAKAAETALEGASLDATGIQRALDVATEGLDPQDDAIASGWYRHEVAPVHLRRLLLDEET